MAQTTTHISACDAAIWLDDDEGTATDISGSTNNVDITFSMTAAELRTFGTRWPVRTSCGKDAKLAIDIVYSTAADEAMDLLLTWFFAATPGARTCSVYLPDKNVGSDHYYGEFVIDGDVSIPAAAGSADPISVTLPLSVTGELTRTTATT